MSVNGFDFDGTVHRYNYNSLDNIPPNIAPAYSASATYAVGDYCTKDNVLYKCSTAISTAEAWNSAHWTQVQLATDVADLKDDLSESVRFTEQTLTDAQKEQARTNLGINLDDINQKIYDLSVAICDCFENVAFENNANGNDLIQIIRDIGSGLPIRIEAVFNQGSHVVYGYHTLESLKEYLTVTAVYSNGTYEEITNYTLSGDLENATSTITVEYEGLTTTFTVAVNIGRLLTSSDVLNNGGFNNFTVNSEGSIVISSAETFAILSFPNATHISFILDPHVGVLGPFWFAYRENTRNSSYYCTDAGSFFNFIKSGNKYNASKTSGVGSYNVVSSEMTGSIPRVGVKLVDGKIYLFRKGYEAYVTNANNVGFWQSNLNYGNMLKVRVYE